MEINLYYIRHGQSCANILPYPYFKDYRDPHLTKVGRNNSIKAGKKLPSMDYVFASELMRAIETAHYMFPLFKRIIVAPYLRELTNGKDNKPMNIKQQNAQIKKKVGDLRFRNKRYPILKSRKHFENWLFKKHLKTCKMKKLNVAIVTHSLWMKHFLNLRKIPKNNEVIKIKYYLNN